MPSPAPEDRRPAESGSAHAAQERSQDRGQRSYAHERAATAAAQARFFHEQAQRHRSEAGQARTFAALSASADERAEHDRRAAHLETLSRHDETIARQIAATRGGGAGDRS